EPPSNRFCAVLKHIAGDRQRKGEMVDTSRFATALVMVGFLLTATAPSAAADGLDLAPVADTFVQSGTEAGWDHGLADHLDVDLTAAFQAGPGLYSLAIVGTSANEASYASRESTVATERPRLHVELGAVAVPPSITTTTTTAPPPPTAAPTTTTTPPPAPRAE